MLAEGDAGEDEEEEAKTIDDKAAADFLGGGYWIGRRRIKAFRSGMKRVGSKMGVVLMLKQKDAMGA